MQRMVFVVLAVVLVSVRVPGQVSGAVSVESFAIRMDGERVTRLQDDDQPCEPERVVPETNQNPTIHEATKAGDLQRVRDLLAQDPTLRVRIARVLRRFSGRQKKGKKTLSSCCCQKAVTLTEKIQRVLHR